MYEFSDGVCWETDPIHHTSNLLSTITNPIHTMKNYTANLLDSAAWNNTRRSINDKQLDVRARKRQFVEDLRRMLTFYGSADHIRRVRDTYDLEIENFHSFKATEKEGTNPMIRKIEVIDQEDGVLVRHNDGNSIKITNRYFETGTFDENERCFWIPAFQMIAFALVNAGLTWKEFSEAA